MKEEPCGEEYSDYYDEAERLPTYKKVSIGLSSFELVQIIVGQDFDPKKVCKVKPVAVHNNVTFVIDLKHVTLKDLGADDNGAWEISCRKQRFQIFREDGCIKSIHYTKDYGKGTITLHGQYAHHNLSFQVFLQRQRRNGNMHGSSWKQKQWHNQLLPNSPP